VSQELQLRHDRRYQGFVQSSLGQLLVKNLGLPDPVP
jgi:hypothetical protein